MMDSFDFIHPINWETAVPLKYHRALLLEFALNINGTITVNSKCQVGVVFFHFPILKLYIDRIVKGLLILLLLNSLGILLNVLIIFIFYNSGLEGETSKCFI